ncbi:MAG: ABC transporter ATP-binding protein [Planctomycetota bacterium]|nr:ABC transporter ATP-binding protein [Planctomycetota bacterium]MDA0919783.1 ABC transporter ATP-binding protein [Planctomycetota bacterium]
MFDSVWNLSSVTLAGRERPRLDNVSLQIRPGATAVMGASGAGKSSLLSLLTGFEEPDDGQLQFAMPETRPPATLPLFWSPQDHGLWSHLTVEQHVGYVLPERAKNGRSAMQWLELFELNELRASLPDSLSQGERSRLAVVRALASEAAVLVLDEPLVHVDPLLAHRCWRVVDEHLRTHGSTVVFSAHDLGTVMKYARNVVCLDHGKVTFSDSVDALWHRPPTKELAWLLGPCNWLRPLDIVCEESARELVSRDYYCVRPSQLALRRNPTGQFVVEAILRTVSLTELRLRERNSSRSFDVFVTRLGDGISIGDSVQMTIVPSDRSAE